MLAVADQPCRLPADSFTSPARGASWLDEVPAPARCPAQANSDERDCRHGRTSDLPVRAAPPDPGEAVGSGPQPGQSHRPAPRRHQAGPVQRMARRQGHHRVGTMWCAYAFTALALVSLPSPSRSRNTSWPRTRSSASSSTKHKASLADQPPGQPRTPGQRGRSPYRSVSAPAAGRRDFAARAGPFHLRVPPGMLLPGNAGSHGRPGPGRQPGRRGPRACRRGPRL